MQMQAAGVERIPIRLAGCVLAGRFYHISVWEGPRGHSKCVCQAAETRKRCSGCPVPTARATASPRQPKTHVGRLSSSHVKSTSTGLKPYSLLLFVRSYGPDMEP